MKNQGKTRVAYLILDIFVWLFLFLGLFSLILTLLSGKSDDGALNLFGHEMRVITSESMEASPDTDVSGFEIGSIPYRSLVWIRTVPDEKEEADAFYAEIRPGDVLTFRYVYLEPVTITHRVTSVTQKENGAYRIELSGDNHAAGGHALTQTVETDKPETGRIIGKVTGQNRVLGFLLFALKKPLCMVLLVIVPATIILVMEVIRLVFLFNRGKKDKVADAKDAEIEELKRRLAILEEDKNTDQDSSTGGQQNDHHI